MTDTTGYIAVLDGAVEDWRWKTKTADQFEASYYSEQEEEAKAPYSIPPQNVTVLDGAVEAWRSETLSVGQYDDEIAWAWQQANACPHCDGFHADHTGWAGMRCIVATGIQPWHWRATNEEGW